ncbi:nitroreductase [Actinoplanes sp. NPDC051851]|uniref:Acg family FMN-binding oxidoreductase n=1 Tax=Actinoplanes sp. NPDC051851 TaxID=3154753 RepID=UPI00344A7164
MSPADSERSSALLQAADAARFAPSIHNTQPWRWVVHPDRLELYSVTERQLQAQDPDGRMLLISCGTALHHAQVALNAGGWTYTLDRPAVVPLAGIRLDGRKDADADAVRLARSLQVRHTDRRTVADEPVARDVLDRLAAATETGGARLHLLSREQVIDLAVAVEHAEKTHAADERIQTETASWTGGGRPPGAGIPAESLPADLPATTVAERDFGTAGTLNAGAGHDGAATYALLYGESDEPSAWLRAGEALSSLWITATELNVGLLPLSSPAEVPATRQDLRRLLGGIGTPYLAVRLGNIDPADAPAARTPRLPVDQVIEVVG